MTPMDPMSAPFCLLFQSNTIYVGYLCAEKAGGPRTVECKEGEREFNAGEDTEE